MPFFCGIVFNVADLCKKIHKIPSKFEVILHDAIPTQEFLTAMPPNINFTTFLKFIHRFDIESTIKMQYRVRNDLPIWGPTTERETQIIEAQIKMYPELKISEYEKSLFDSFNVVESKSNIIIGKPINNLSEFESIKKLIEPHKCNIIATIEKVTVLNSDSKIKLILDEAVIMEI